MGNPIAERPSFLDRVSVCLATGFHVGSIPAALVDRFKDHHHGRALIEKKWLGAGLLGSIEGAATYLLLPSRIADAWWMLAIALGAAVYFSGRAEQVMDSHDDPRIVIDEWIGSWVALWGLGRGRIAVLILAVALFRFFDIFKGPIGRRLQTLPGGWGVTMDDVYAGLAANLAWRVAVLFIPSL